MLRARFTEEQRLAEAVVIIPCRHGWQTLHCTRDDEGSHPGSLSPDDECYCGEAVCVPLLEIMAVREP